MIGVVYIAYGDPARREAGYGIASLRAVHPDLPVAVIGEAPIAGTRFIPWERQDAGARWAKVNLGRLTPFEDTLYLDADTRVRAPLMAGFDALQDGWDMALTTSANQECDWLWHVSEAERARTEAQVGRALQLQAGMMFWRTNAATARLFERWAAEWQVWRGQDQAALLRALDSAPVRVCLLGRCFNSAGGAVVDHRFGMAREG